MSQLADRSAAQLLPAFWPLSDPHAVGHVAIDAEPPADLEAVLPLLLRLAAQSDAMRSLQTADGSLVCERGASALRQEMAEGMLELAEQVDNTSAAIIRLRADALDGRTDAREMVLEIAAQGVTPALEIVCGPLCTWRPKTRAPLHSFLAAARDEHFQELLDSFDASLEEALDELRENFDAPGMKVSFALPMNVTNLLASGGEAGGHPKHFAYFLPEDEGVDDLPIHEQRTLYLRNVHLMRYSAITIPLAETLLDGPMRAREVPTEATLMPWIRGHDHGHNVIVPETDYDSWRETLGIEPFMALQEAIADVYGFLMTISEPWLRIGGYSRLEMCATHIAEMLHYMRRGPQYYGDPGAAYVELSFLAENGFVEIDPRGRIRWTEEGFCQGMTELAEELTRSTVGAPDEKGSEALLERYGWPAETPAKRTLEAMREELTHVPTSLAFYSASEVAISAGLPLAA
jgi:hypothetical protein